MNTNFWPEEVTSHLVSYLPMQSLPSFAATCRACNDAVANEGHWQVRYLDRFGSRLPSVLLPDVEALSWRTQFKNAHLIEVNLNNAVESSHQVEHHQWPPPPPVQQEGQGRAVCIKMCCKRLCIFYIILIIPFMTIVNVVINIWLEPDIGQFLLISFDVLILILGLWYVIRVDGQVRSILHISSRDS